MSITVSFLWWECSHLFIQILKTIINITEFPLCARPQRLCDGEGKINGITVLKNFTTQGVKRQVNSYGKVINDPPKSPMCQCANSLPPSIQIQAQVQPSLYSLFHFSSHLFGFLLNSQLQSSTKFNPLLYVSFYISNF